MRFRLGTGTIGLLAAGGVLLLPAAAGGQAGPWRGSAQQQPPPARPDQPVAPRHPTLQRRPPARQPMRAPFLLRPHEQAQLDRALNAWEQHSAGVKTFACEFKRWEYDLVWGPTDKARFEDVGVIKYAAPDRGLFKVEGDRAEHWICDGKSFWQYDFARKLLIEHKLPPHMQGKAIRNGPLPFLFGTKAADLKQRYFLRVITPQGVRDQTWLEAYPRFQADAANFSRAELILDNRAMTPFALQIHLPNGKTRTAYRFHKIVINDPLGFLKGNPFHASRPRGWKTITEETSAPQVGRQPATNRRQ